MSLKIREAQLDDARSMARLMVNTPNQTPRHRLPRGPDPNPSKADIQMTRKIIDAGHPVGVSVHDHLVIGMGQHVSFKALGLIWMRSRF